MFKKFVYFVGLSLCFHIASVLALDENTVNTESSPTLVLPTPKPAELTLVRHVKSVGLPEEILTMMAQSNVPTDGLSVYIHDLNADAPLVLFNDKVERNPASTMKLVTTWAALKTLGPAYTWKTENWIRGSLKDGVLNGDLILKGYGDPFLVDETFQSMLHDLQLKGLKDIRGNLIIDNSYFNLPPQNAAEFDGEPSKIYNAIPSALMYNFQGTRFLLEADDTNNRVNVSMFPVAPTMQIDNRLQLDHGGCAKAHYNPGFRVQGNVIQISGSYSSDCGKNFILRVLGTPEETVFNAFRDTWQGLGGKFNGKLQTGQVQPSDTLLHSAESRSLGEQIRFVNKWSNNVMARELLLTAGARKYGEPATLDKGQQVLMDVLQDANVDTTGMVIDNGSGLSREERVSAYQLGSLLEAAWRDPYMPEYMASLPLLGEDGTLANRLKDGDLRGRSHMKTGTLKDASAIAGYMITRTGKRLIVVVMQNGAGTSHGIQDAILKWAFEQ